MKTMEKYAERWRCAVARAFHCVKCEVFIIHLKECSANMFKKWNYNGMHNKRCAFNMFLTNEIVCVEAMSEKLLWHTVRTGT